MRVLVVDDFANMRKTIKNALTYLGFSDIVTARHGKEAHDIIIANHGIKGKRIDLCISDWNMPVMAGISLLKKVRLDDRVKDTVFILLTAEGNKESIMTAAQGGVDAYIVKPFNHETLEGKLFNILKTKLAIIEKEIEEYFGAADSGLNVEDFESGEKAEIAEFKTKIHKACEIAPWSGAGRLAMAGMFFRFKEYGQAEISVRKAISLDFGNTKAHNLLSKILMITGKICESTNQIRIAVNMKPNSGELNQKLGEAYLKEGRYEMAIGPLLRSLRLLDEKNVKAMAKSKNALGKAKMAKASTDKDHALKDEAIGDMEDATKLDPDFISAHYDLMVAYKKIGKTKEALAVYEFLKEAEPKDDMGWIALGMAYLERSEPQKALFAFKKADGLADGKYAAYEEISNALFQNRMMDEALFYSQKAKKCNPSDMSSYNMNGIIHRIKGDYAEAVKEYLCASKLEPDNGGILFNIGVAHFKSGQKEKSVKFFRKAQELNPLMDEVDEYLKQLDAVAHK